MNTPFSPMAAFDGGVGLSELGLLRAHGADAAQFLHSQLTNDVLTLEPAQARLAGFCSAKGRLQASFVMWQVAPDDIHLACSRDLLAATLKRLSMFVLRARCKLSDATADWQLTGLAGAPAQALAAGMAAWQRRAIGDTTVLRLPDGAGVARCLSVRPATAAADEALPALPLDAWQWLGVQSGVPTIEAATVDRFVPQMLNYELLGGVDFGKGCYPGQEVVARSQYRGTLKRRMFLFDVDAPAAAGQEVFHSAEPGQPCGLIANAAARPDGGGSSLLVEIKLTALEAGSVHLGAPDGPPLRQGALPYAVPREAAEAAAPSA